jgi:hypothetical protein
LERRRRRRRFYTKALHPKGVEETKKGKINGRKRETDIWKVKDLFSI